MNMKMIEIRGNEINDYLKVKREKNESEMKYEIVCEIMCVRMKWKKYNVWQ